ncbi:Rqc2 family fibronectin-binding protein [Anaerotignum sp. MB30-C6]|uniref:Rqc2 family fibronectin-binding protein n=1 Tax=Anaerotignum sp. MB30-C6 TaxID=3070814 RepID=UPI0027DAF0D9|nr:NFACT RNA binding domain-containing protein [Anaerotignum sp. MB30-C6]WMI80435.1 NFACT RNA binding domain-containing protein [Anaerotignum sp. MB30-C6]
MALDGITTAAIVHELKTKLIGGRIDKIHQPVADEIRFTVRGIGVVHKILASANSGTPRIHITETARENPMTAPLFCMVLRKHIAGGRIIDISQPDFERIVIIKVESANEMGDMTVKHLILEIMGKHSNLILTDETGRILDSIKRITHEKSSVREVLPGKEYVFPPSQNKKNPLTVVKSDFLYTLHLQEGQKLQEFLYKNYTGISPIMAGEMCFRASLDPSNSCQQTTTEESEHLFIAFQQVMDEVKQANFTPKIYYHPNSNRVLDFAVVEMSEFHALEQKNFTSVSSLLEGFYQERDNAYHIRQKAHDMRRLVVSNIERCIKKKEIQLKTRKDVADMEIWRKKGELLTANIYAIPQGVTTYRTIDFYDENMGEIEIALDPTKTPAENAQKYFSRYNKAKRTLTALEIQEKQNDEELLYLESVLNALESASDDADLSEIRTELAESGFIRRQAPKKGASKPKKAKPLHFVSADGFDIFVGKSNLQNDELTLRFADSTDIWMHTKDIPGSHVIIKTNGTGTASDGALEEAAHLAAYFSKAKNSSMVPVDYTLRKNVKKPNGAKPGMVIYLTNRTIYVTPDENKIQAMETM